MDDRLAMHSSSAFEMDIAPSSPQSSRRSTFDATPSPFAKPNFSFDTNHHNPVSVFSSTASSSSASAFPPPQPSISVPALFSSSSSNNVVAFEDSTHFHPPSPFTFSFASFSSSASASASASASSLGGGRKRSRRGWDNTNDELAEHGYFFGKQQHGEEEEEEEEECEQGRPPYDREQLKAVYKRMRLMKPFHQQQQQQASLQNLVRSHSAKEEEEEEEDAEGGVGILFSSRTLSTAPTIVQARREQEEEENGEMSVLIKTLTGKAITIRATPSYTVEQLKELLEEKSGVPASQQRIIWRGRQMADERTLAEYNVRGGSLLHLVLALRGGGGGSSEEEAKTNEQRRTSSPGLLRKE